MITNYYYNFSLCQLLIYQFKTTPGSVYMDLLRFYLAPHQNSHLLLLLSSL